jgi:predicted MPP superfamily phosphohydrolase
MIISTILIVLLSFSVLVYKANRNTKDVIINIINPVNVTSSAHNSPLRVLQLSDLHLENLSISPEKLYEILKHENLDLIALTGDYLERKRSIPKLIPYLEVFQKLCPTFGTFAVFGNHDYMLKGESLRNLKETLEQYNIRVMQNENETLMINGELFHIIGIDDSHSKKSNVHLAYNGIPEEGYRLILTHDPNVVFQMRSFDFHYLLSGHFHGGQICWPKPYHLKKFGKLVHLNLIKGLINYDGKVFYINEGLGQTLFNIRVGSRPEITIHELSISRSI